MKRVKLIALLLALVTVISFCAVAMAAETKTVTITADDFKAAGVGSSGYMACSFTTADGLRFDADKCTQDGNQPLFNTLCDGKDTTATFTAPQDWQILRIEGAYYTGDLIKSYTEPANFDYSRRSFSWQSLNEKGEASVSFTGGTNGTYANAGVWGPFTITLIKTGVPKTGDTNNILLHVGLMLISAAAAMYFGAKVRKYN